MRKLLDCCPSDKNGSRDGSSERMKEQDKERLAFKCQEEGAEGSISKAHGIESSSDELEDGLSKMRADYKKKKLKLRVKLPEPTPVKERTREEPIEAKAPKSDSSPDGPRYKFWDWRYWRIGNEDPSHLTHEKKVKYLIAGSIPAAIILFIIIGVLVSNASGSGETEEEWVVLNARQNSLEGRARLVDWSAYNDTDIEYEGGFVGIDGQLRSSKNQPPQVSIKDRPPIQLNPDSSIVDGQIVLSNSTGHLPSSIKPHHHRKRIKNLSNSNTTSPGDLSRLRVALWGFNFEAAKIPRLKHEPQFYFVVSFKK